MSSMLPRSLLFLRQFEFPKKLGICERIYGKTLAQMGECVIECASGVTWRLNLNEVGHRWMVYGYYEGGVGIRYAERKLRHGGVYLDSGANIGQWVSYLSGIANLKTYAFEPVPSENAWLRECLAYNTQLNVEVIDSALGAKNDVLQMQCSGPRSTLRTDWYQNESNEVINVPICQLDAFISDRKIDEITFWKLDVEGHEFEVLIGAGASLQRSAIKSIYFECHPDNFSRIKRYLGEHGYALYRLSKNGLSPIGSYQPVTTEDFVAEPVASVN